MKIYEDLRHTLDNHVRRCWRCGHDLKDGVLKGKANPEIRCRRCGFIVEIDLYRHRLINGFFAVGILAGMLGFIIGTIIAGIMP